MSKIISFFLIFLAATLMAFVIWLYFELSVESLESWMVRKKFIGTDVLGQFGDFIGGTLNPLFGLLAFGAILWTIILQSRELQSTREQLKIAAQAQKEQVENLRLQLKQTEQNAKVEVTVRMFERWTSEQMRNHRMIAWKFLRKRYGLTGVEPILLYEIEDRRPETFLAIGQVNQFLSDLYKLTTSDRLDDDLVFKLFVDSLYPWYAFVARFQSRPAVDKDKTLDFIAKSYEMGVDDWYRNKVLGLRQWFDDRRS